MKADETCSCRHYVIDGAGTLPQNILWRSVPTITTAPLPYLLSNAYSESIWLSYHGANGFMLDFELN